MTVGVGCIMCVPLEKNTVTRQCTFATIAQKSNFVLFFIFIFLIYPFFSRKTSFHIDVSEFKFLMCVQVK